MIKIFEMPMIYSCLATKFALSRLKIGYFWLISGSILSIHDPVVPFVPLVPVGESDHQNSSRQDQLFSSQSTDFWGSLRYFLSKSKKFSPAARFLDSSLRSSRIAYNFWPSYAKIGRHQANLHQKLRQKLDSSRSNFRPWVVYGFGTPRGVVFFSIIVVDVHF